MKNIYSDIRKQSDPERTINLQRFFKTKKGEYGEGDVFLGLTVPQCRKVVKQYKILDLCDVLKLLKSKYHEERLIALLIFVEQFSKGDPKKRKEIYDNYLNNTKYINNWDLVDLSAHKIVGAYLFDKNRSVLYKLAKSSDLWEKRISIIATAWFIKNNDFDDTLNISDILLNDKHDLIHKAVGWMLREIGNNDLLVEEKFLKSRYKTMPRTMLRYAIEKFEEGKRKKYLKGEI